MQQAVNGAEADRRRRVQAHLRPEPGGRGVSRGLHGVAEVSARRRDMSTAEVPDHSADDPRRHAADAGQGRRSNPRRAYGGNCRHTRTCRARTAAMENRFDHPQDRTAPQGTALAGVSDATPTACSASSTTRRFTPDTTHRRSSGSSGLATSRRCHAADGQSAVVPGLAGAGRAGDRPRLRLIEDGGERDRTPEDDKFWI